MKYFTSILAVLFIMSGFNMVYAGSDNNRCHQVNGIWVDCSETNNIDNSTTALGGAGGAGGAGGQGGQGGEGGKGGKGGDAKQKQAQGQIQGQLQGQVQGNMNVVAPVQVTEISIKDQRKTVQTIIDFNHITPNIGNTSAEHKSVNDTMRVKAISDIDGMIQAITLKSARKLGSATSDFKMFKELLFENDFQTTMLSKGARGDFMGSIILTPTGSKVTLGGLQGKAYEAAMAAGATHWEMHNFSGQYTEGSKAGIDFGSAASVAAKSDGSAVIAPGATLGYSTAWSNNEYRPGIIIDLYFDDTMVITPVAKVQPIITR